MDLAVVGSIAFDAVKTPFGERERMLGGSAVHFSLAASYFTDVRVVGPVGDDFGEGEYAVLHGRGVNTDDIEHVEGGKTFFWAGEYEWNVNIRHTLDTQLNVFGEFEPKLSDGAKQADILFLANIQPDLQRDVREQCSAKIAGLDSMTSNSRQNSTNITLQFALNRDIDGATVDVQTAIAAAMPLLPPGMPSPPSFRKTNPGDSPIISIFVTSPTTIPSALASSTMIVFVWFSRTSPRARGFSSSG